MKTLKFLLALSTLCLCVAALPAFGADEKEKPAPAKTPATAPYVVPSSVSGKWLTDYKKAAEIAKASGRIMLLDFTGSDWCGWCIKLDKEVFDKAEFKKYAKDNLILVKLDFPKRKKLPKPLQEQNAELSKKYGIKGYPTIIVLDSGEKQIGQLGYTEGGPKAFIAEVEKLKPAKK